MLSLFSFRKCLNILTDWQINTIVLLIAENKEFMENKISQA